MPKPYPIEFRRDIVAVARKREASLSQIAKDFGIWEACVLNWLKKADIEDGLVPGMTVKDTVELRGAKKLHKPYFYARVHRCSYLFTTEEDL